MLLWHVHLFCYIFHYFSLAFWCSCAISHTSRTCSAAIFEIGNSICCTNQTTRWHNYSTSKFQFSMKTEQKSLMRYAFGLPNRVLMIQDLTLIPDSQRTKCIYFQSVSNVSDSYKIRFPYIWMSRDNFGKSLFWCKDMIIEFLVTKQILLR